MNALHRFILPALLVASLAAHAQNSASLNLKLPRGSVPATSSSSATPTPMDTGPARAATVARPSAAAAAAPRPAPGVYYGDTSGRTYADEGSAPMPTCDDATYNQPQMHGSVGVGVVSGSHWNSGTYNMGSVNLSQRFGSCNHPTGGVGISIGTSRFNGH